MSHQAGGRHVQICNRCIMPNTRPRVQFNSEGVCNACLHAEKKPLIDWNCRREEFIKFIEPYRSKNNKWDCLVPWSGGKDSSAIAYRLKFEFGMNPLLATFSPMLPTDIGHNNRENLIRLGFDHVYHRPNQAVHRKLAKRFLIERGHPKVAWDAGINAFPIQLAVSYKIPLVFYAEHGETEYGGKVIHENSSKIRDFTEVIEHQIGDDPRNWENDGVSLQNLNPYIYPELKELENLSLKALYFGWFFKWSMFDNFNYLKDKMTFLTHPKGRTPGTFTDFDSIDDKMDLLYYHMQYIKFGFGRATRDACRMIQNGQMTREEAIEKAELYDSEFPEEHLDDVLDYLQLNRSELEAIIDKHRNPEIWKREHGKWMLRFSVH